MTRSKAILVAFDQLLAAIITKYPDASLSAWAYVWARDGKRRWVRRLIDGLFFWESKHCYNSYLSERTQKQYPPWFFEGRK